MLTTADDTDVYVSFSASNRRVLRLLCEMMNVPKVLGDLEFDDDYVEALEIVAFLRRCCKEED